MRTRTEKKVVQTLAGLIRLAEEAGMDFETCLAIAAGQITAEAAHDTGAAAEYRDAARRIYEDAGDITIDEDARVSRTEDGAYVWASLWVPHAQLA